MVHRWEFWIDQGGTFTDCVAFDPASGEYLSAKVPSGPRSVAHAIRATIGFADDTPIPPSVVRVGTTVATNALLERRGARTALVVTAGFADLAVIGDQTRPDLFARRIEPVAPIAETTIAIALRATSEGSVVGDIDDRALHATLQLARDAGIEAVAIALINSWAAPEIELRVEAIARRAGFEFVDCSCRVSPELGYLARLQTTVLNAYLAPIVRTYAQALREQLPDARLEFMQSHGGLIDAEHFEGRHAVLSGPAGGAVALASIVRALPLAQAIGFDMGGTSTDVCRAAETQEFSYDHTIAGVAFRTPMLPIHTVAAGGGSICRVRDGALHVGPESAGADPGPLCYGKPHATDLTLTDVALLLGRLIDDRFPGELRTTRAQEAVRAQCAELRHAGEQTTETQLLDGYYALGIEHMANAIARVTIERGHDARTHALVVFGGAGGQFACSLARKLQMRRIVFHPLSGTLSAFGIGVAPRRWTAERDAGRVLLLGANTSSWRAICDTMAAEGSRALGSSALDVRYFVALRYEGTETAIDIALHDDPHAMATAFTDAHHARFDYVRPDARIEAAALRCEVVQARPVPQLVRAASGDHASRRSIAMNVCGVKHQAHVYWSEDLRVDTPIKGPAIIAFHTSTLCVDPGFVCRKLVDGTVVVDDTEDLAREGASSREQTHAPIDAVSVQLFRHRFTAIADMMGDMLKRVATSTNIRDRHDYSCAVFDAHGELIVNAPHIPVHLGAMSETVKAVYKRHPNPSIGTSFASNAPFAGGSHLPDITVVTPVHDRDGTLRAFVASRGHHADVGGLTPGSMPPESRTLDDEGVVFDAIAIEVNGELQLAAITTVLSSTAFPARAPQDNIADLRAQLAANRRGVRLLAQLFDTEGADLVCDHMRRVCEHAERVTRAAIAALDDGVRTFADALDDGTEIRCAITIAGDSMHIDFSGTSGTTANNLNAPRAVTLASVLYCVRLLVDEPIPLNGGCLRPIRVTIPTDSILDPPRHAAVAAGNVETSQRVVDVILGALQLAAASQGTMNNVTFGTTSFGYYETLGGGSGATPDGPGRGGVHTHMTNSKCTDPEVIEARFPVRITAFELRPGSGGAGTHRGGDGLRRTYEFLSPMTVSLITERRVRAPYGLAGGLDAQRGANYLNGAALPFRSSFEVVSGDTLTVDTPGGGGWGTPP